MAYDPERIVQVGELEKRGNTVRFGIKEKDRSRHIYVIGQTGTGKSTLLEMLAMQDIRNGTGLIFMDPHGQSVEALLKYVTPEHLDKIIYFAPHYQEKPIGLNIMEDIGYDKRHLVVSSLMASFEKIWGAGTWSDRMAYILQNTLLALIEYPGTTLLDVGRMYSSKDFREKVVANLKDPQVRKYWVEEYANYTERYAQEATPSIQNKLGQFTSNPLMRNIIGQEKSAFNFREIMDEGKILLVNLSKGQVGENNARMLGVLFTTKIYLAALSRSDLDRAHLEAANPCNFFVDEFQSFANSSFSDILSEARKYKLNLVMAHQYLGQLYTDDTGGGDAIRDAVFGNVGTFVSFRVGPVDAEIISKQFAPDIAEEDLVALPRYHIYLTLNIDGAGSVPFSARTFFEPPPTEDSMEEEVVQRTMDTYGVDRDVIEKIVADNLAEDEKAKEKTGKGGKQQGSDRKKQGGQKGNETHTPLKGLVQQIQQHGSGQTNTEKQKTEKPKKQTAQDDSKAKAEKQDAKSVPIVKTDSKADSRDERADAASTEKKRAPLLKGIFKRNQPEPEPVSDTESTEAAPTPTPAQKTAHEPKEKKEYPITPAVSEKKDDGMNIQRDTRKADIQKPQRTDRKRNERRQEREPRNTAPQRTRDAAPERPRELRNKRPSQRERNDTRHNNSRQRPERPEQRKPQQHRNTERQRGRTPALDRRQQSERPQHPRQNTQRQTPSHKPIAQTKQERNRLAKNERLTQRRRQERQQQEPDTVRRPNGVITGTIARSMAAPPPTEQSVTKPDTENKQQEAPKKQQPQPRPNISGGLGDLVKSTKSTGLQKDLKVAPKREKQAPPVSYEEGWVAIGDLSKTSQ